MHNSCCYTTVYMGFTKEILSAGDPTKGPTKNKEVTVNCTGYGENGDLNACTTDPGHIRQTFSNLEHNTYLTMVSN